MMEKIAILNILKYNMLIRQKHGIFQKDLNLLHQLHNLCMKELDKQCQQLCKNLMSFI
jgi:hypothetical protein